MDPSHGFSIIFAKGFAWIFSFPFLSSPHPLPIPPSRKIIRRAPCDNHIIAWVQRILTDSPCIRPVAKAAKFLREEYYHNPRLQWGSSLSQPVKFILVRQLALSENIVTVTVAGKSDPIPSLIGLRSTATESISNVPPLGPVLLASWLLPAEPWIYTRQQGCVAAVFRCFYLVIYTMITSESGAKQCWNWSSH